MPKSKEKKEYDYGLRHPTLVVLYPFHYLLVQ